MSIQRQCKRLQWQATCRLIVAYSRGIVMELRRCGKNQVIEEEESIGSHDENCMETVEQGRLDNRFIH